MPYITIPRQIGQVVRAHRKTLGMTQRELARAANISERLVVALEKGEASGIGIDNLLRILASLHLSLSIDAVEHENQEDAPTPRPSKSQDADRAWEALPFAIIPNGQSARSALPANLAEKLDSFASILRPDNE